MYLSQSKGGTGSIQPRDTLTPPPGCLATAAVATDLCRVEGKDKDKTKKKANLGAMGVQPPSSAV